MSLPNRGRVTLRLQYWHQSPVGESSQHQATLREFVKDYLALLANSTSSSYPWDCRLVGLEQAINQPRRIVPVQVCLVSSFQSVRRPSKLILQYYTQVNLVHRHYTHNNAEASSQCRELWDKLKGLTGSQEFRELFASPMISMNIYPVGLADPWAKDYTFGMIVQNLAVEPNHIIHVAENSLEFLGDSA